MDDNLFNQHQNMIYLICTKSIYTNEFSVLTTNVKTIKTTCNLQKIKLIKILETELNVQSLDINSYRDRHNFQNIINLDETTKNNIIMAFRITKCDIINNNSYRNWYYQLIQMYKNVVGNIFDRKRIRLENSKNQMYLYKTDWCNIKKHIELYSIKYPKLDDIYDHLSQIYNDVDNTNLKYKILKSSKQCDHLRNARISKTMIGFLKMISQNQKTIEINKYDIDIDITC